MQSNIKNLTEQVNKYDRDRFLCSLFCKEEYRNALHIIYAFNLEIAKIPEFANEAMLGMIRLQWWREAIEEIYSGKRIRQHEVVAAISELIPKYKLPEEYFLKTIDAREADIGEYPISNNSELIIYAENTSSTILRLVGEVLGVEDEIISDVGVLWALTGIMRSVKFNNTLNKCFLPRDILEHHKIDIHNLPANSSLPEVIKQVHSIASEVLSTVRDRITRLNKEKIRALLPILLLTTISDVYLKRIRKAGYDVFSSQIEGGRSPINLKVLYSAYTLKF